MRGIRADFDGGFEDFSVTITVIYTYLHVFLSIYYESLLPKELPRHGNLNYTQSS